MTYRLAALDIAALALAICIFLKFVQHRRRSVLPPGPRGLPIIGNLLDMPTSHEWEIFTEWKHTWGDLVYLNIIGKPIVVINSPRHAFELLDKRAARYSNRPDMLVTGHLVGWTRMLVSSQYGAKLRDMRRMLAQMMGSKGSMTHLFPMIERAQSKLMLRLWKDPDSTRVHPERHARMMAAAVSLELAYGYKVHDDSDNFVRILEAAVDVFNETSSPGALLADALPSLLVPGFLLGVGWKWKIAPWQKGFLEMVDLPFEWAKQQMVEGTDFQNVTATHLQEDASSRREETVKMAAAAIYSGAADTTVSSTASFFLAMMLHPEVQKKAQAEIDAVVGRDRLPTYADRETLPFIGAVWKEVLRWNPVVPQGVPHSLAEDDVYEGYVFRSGTTFIANIWGFVHDPETYKDPLAFEPSRFIQGGIDGASQPEPHPSTFVFGFGRRGCAGQLLAEASTYMTCLLGLALFSIVPAARRAKDGYGKPEV